MTMLVMLKADSVFEDVPEKQCSAAHGQAGDCQHDSGVIMMIMCCHKDGKPQDCPRLSQSCSRSHASHTHLRLLFTLRLTHAVIQVIVIVLSKPSPLSTPMLTPPAHSSLSSAPPEQLFPLQHHHQLTRHPANYTTPHTSHADVLTPVPAGRTYVDAARGT